VKKEKAGMIPAACFSCKADLLFGILGKDYVHCSGQAEYFREELAMNQGHWYSFHGHVKYLVSDLKQVLFLFSYRMSIKKRKKQVFSVRNAYVFSLYM
jgi:hypothetical protein